jgi:hypothetical protein
MKADVALVETARLFRLRWFGRCTFASATSAPPGRKARR